MKTPRAVDVVIERRLQQLMDMPRLCQQQYARIFSSFYRRIVLAS